MTDRALAEGEAAQKLEEAGDRFYQAEVAAQARYRKDLAEVIAAAERIELYLLDHVTEETPSDYMFWETRLPEGEFPIMPYGAKSKALKKAVLTPEQRSEFLPAFKKVLTSESSGGALCHFPIHGVRVFSGEKIVFQTSICWHCGNFYVHYPNGAHWEGIGGGEDLAKVFEKLMPIPQEEKDRFQKAFSPKKAGAEDQGKDAKQRDK